MARPRASNPLGGERQRHFATRIVTALKWLFDHEVTGCAHFREPAGLTHRVWLRSGRVVWLETHDPVVSLPAVFVERGLVPEHQIGVLAELAPDALKLADLLVRRDIAAPRAVAAGVRDCVARRFAYLFECNDTVDVALVECADVPAYFESLPTDNLFASAARSLCNIALVDRYIEKLGDSALLIKEEPGFEPTLLTPSEQQVLDALLGARFKIAAMELSHEARTVRTLVFALAMAGRVVRISERESMHPVNAHTPPTTNPPSSLVRRSKKPDALEAGEAAAEDAERAVRRGAFDEARKAIARALTLDRSRPAWRALSVFIDVEAAGTLRKEEASAFYGRMLAALDAIVDDAPGDPAVLYVRARVFKRAGKKDRALADFRRVVEVDPTNRHARDEVRRGRDTQPPRKRKGWLSR